MGREEQIERAREKELAQIKRIDEATDRSLKNEATEEEAALLREDPRRHRIALILRKLDVEQQLTYLRSFKRGPEARQQKARATRFLKSVSSDLVEVTERLRQGESREAITIAAMATLLRSAKRFVPRDGIGSTWRKHCQELGL